MHYLGKTSVSSLLGGAVNVAWYILLSVAVILLLVALVASFIPQQYIPDFTTGALSLETGFITLGFDQITVTNPRFIALGFLGFALIMVVFAAAVIKQLRKIFANLRADLPFAPDNARRIRIMGVLVLAGTIAKSLLFFPLSLVLMNNVLIKGVEIKARLGNLDLTSIFMGLLILVLAEIFRYGSELQEERNLTV